MSMTKTTAKFVKTATTLQIISHRDEFIAAKAIEKNPMIRSSLSERIQICNNELNRRVRVRLVSE
jgi:hypothetical protein